MTGICVCLCVCVLNCMSYFYVLEMNPLWISPLQVFSPLLFHLVWDFLCCAVGSHIRHYWQMEARPHSLSLSRRHGPGMKELGLVILTCFFLSLVELTEKNIKVLIVLERSMRRHKAFCSCAQRIIHKVNHWHSFKDLYRRVFQDEHVGCSLRPWEGLLYEAYLWGKCLWQRSLLNLGLRNN